MGVTLTLEVPFVVGVVLAVAVIVILALAFLLDVWTEVRELFGEVRDWWHDRRH